jgi:hypothetical protein
VARTLRATPSVLQIASTAIRNGHQPLQRTGKSYSARELTSLGAYLDRDWTGKAFRQIRNDGAEALQCTGDHVQGLTGICCRRILPLVDVKRLSPPYLLSPSCQCLSAVSD